MADLQRLFGLFKLIDLPQTGSLQSYKWIADHQVIKWMCDNLAPANVVQAADVTLYEDLCVAGLAELTDDELRSNDGESRASFNSFLHDETVDELEAQVKACDDEIALLENCLGVAKQLSNAAESVLEPRRKRAVAQHHLTASSLSGLAQEKAAAAETSLHVRDALDTLHSVLQDISHLVKVEGSKWLFLASDLSAYRSKEDRYMQEVNRYIVKELITLPSQAGSLNSDMPAFLYKASDEQQQDMQEEVHRLRWVFQLAKRQLGEAVMECQGAKTELATAQQLVQDAELPGNLYLEQEQLKTLRISVPNLLDRKEALLTELAEVCKHLGDAQDAAMMQQEYKNKLLRQQYYNAKKEAMINLLLSQCCRQVVVEASRMLERSRLEQVQQLLNDLNSRTSTLTHYAQHRHTCYSARASKLLEPKNTIQEHDRYLTAFHQMLVAEPCSPAMLPVLLHNRHQMNVQGDATQETSTSGGVAGFPGLLQLPAAGIGLPTRTPGYVTVRQFVSQLEQLATSSNKVTQDILQTHEEANTIFASHHRACQELYDLVFTNGSPSRSFDAANLRPVLTSPLLASTKEQLQASNAELAGVVNEIAKQHCDYETLLDQNKRQLHLERRVMDYFFTRPERLNTAVEQLRQQIEGTA